MIFEETPLPGVHLIRLEKREDERGFFARAFCREEFLAHGLEPHVAQANSSLSRQAGTLRGMHFQFSPMAETKIVRCARGSLYDVVVDLRPDSPAHRRWFGAELTAANGEMLFVPRGCAHGFLTLEADTEAYYLVSAPYAAEFESGVRFDDPAFGIEWPNTVEVISPKDDAWPPYEPDERMCGLLTGSGGRPA